eukprot:6617760-Karenia_brevis.AAC.1
MLSAVQRTITNKGDISQEWYPHFNIFVKGEADEPELVGSLGDGWKEEVTQRLLGKSAQELIALSTSRRK